MTETKVNSGRKSILEMATTLISGNSEKNRKGRKGPKRRRVQEDFFLSSHVACQRKVKRAPNSKREPKEIDLRRENHLNSRDKKSILIVIVIFKMPNNNNNVLVTILIDKAMLLQAKAKDSNKIEGKTMMMTSIDGESIFNASENDSADEGTRDF